MPVFISYRWAGARGLCHSESPHVAPASRDLTCISLSLFSRPLQRHRIHKTGPPYLICRVSQPQPNLSIRAASHLPQTWCYAHYRCAQLKPVPLCELLLMTHALGFDPPFLFAGLPDVPLCRRALISQSPITSAMRAPPSTRFLTSCIPIVRSSPNVSTD